MNRDKLALRPWTALVLAAGMSVSVSAWARDDGGGSMDDAKKSTPPAKADAKPAAADHAEAKHADAKAKPVAEQGPSSNELLNDFVHYVLIDRPDLAQSMGTALLERNIGAADFAKLVESATGVKRFTSAVLRGQRRSDLETVSSSLLRLYEEGKRAGVRHPDSIAAGIRQLTGNLREREYARAGLREAGEYATPQLLSALLDRTNAARSAEVRQVLVEMGRQAVMPLSTALPKLGPADQEMVAGVLGDIPYTQSLPFLYEVINNPGSDQTRAAGEEAVRRIVGALATQVPQADRYAKLAAEYSSGSPSLIPFPGDANQPVWSYEPAIGLTFQSIDTRLYTPMMAMRMSEQSLRNDAKHSGALATWLESNFRRELNTPKDYENPLYAKDRRDATYYAVAAGAGPCQTVLGKALANSDTPMARRALAALERTAGGATLWKGAEAGGSRPLLDALRYPSRRVQYDAALALAAAGPREAFPGSDQVVRTLASAVRDAGAKYVLVLAAETERQSSLSELFRAAGYTPLASAVRLEDARQAIADAPGVDLLVTDLPVESTIKSLDAALGDAKLRATPVLAMASSAGAADLNSRFGRDARVHVARQGLTPKEVQSAAAQLVDAASGGEMSNEDSTYYRDRALGMLRDLGISANPVLNVADAGGPLVSALGDAKGDLRHRIAEALTFIPTKASQTAIVEAALTSKGEDRVRLLNHASAGAKRAGNLLEEVQIARVVDLAKDGQGEEATAAAALLGALNLSGGEVVPLILGGK